jgi:hypothetical protein
MAFRIEESFTVRAPVERVWGYLVDPRQVAGCLPGAELTEVRDERTFLGKIRVKVGPVTAAYGGTAQLVEVNEEERRVQIAAEGRESGGAGSARMRMTSTVAALPDDEAGARSEVRVEAELDLAGKIVQFGRGMVETVNKQLFAQFTVCVRSRLEAVEAPAGISAPAAPVAGSGVTIGAPAAAPSVIAPADATRVAVPRGSAPPVSRPAEPVRLIPLLWRALRESVARLFGRKARS